VVEEAQANIGPEIMGRGKFGGGPDPWGEDPKKKLPKGAYVPFGGGSRTCIGMRFGLLEVATIATLILHRFRLEVEPGYVVRTRQMPTLSPRKGMPVRIRGRDMPASMRAAA
jgi:cytochrome P450